MVTAYLAQPLGDFVAYLASLSAATGVAGRFWMDWKTRGRRHPSHLEGISPDRRAQEADDRAWRLWVGTVAGAWAGFLVGALALVIDGIQR